MDQWKKNLPVRTENFNVRLTSHGLEKDRTDSLYEIDIQSSFDVIEKEAKVPGKVTFEGCLTKPLDRFSKERTIKEDNFEKTLELLIPKPEGKKHPPKQNSKLQSNSSTERHESDKVDFEKPGKENQSPDAEAAKKFKEYIKRHLIENFISKNDPPMKSIFQNISTELDKTHQLHFHHHEHHHYYYFDDSPTNGGASQFYEATTRSKSVSDHENSPTEKKTDGKPVKAYYFNCPPKSTHTYTKVDGAFIKNNAFDTSKDDESFKLKKALKSSTAIPCSKAHNSVETIFCNTSDFLTSHFYDDLDQEKCNSKEINRPEPEKEKSSLGDSNMKDSYGANSKMPRDSDDKIQTIKTPTSKQVQVHPMIKEDNKDWGENVRAELSYIKKELQRLEERHLLKRLNKKTDNIHKISVYSNKTFIVGSEKLFLNKKRQKENVLEKSGESQVTERYYFVKSENVSGEKKDCLRKKFASRKQHLYSRGVYMIPNKV